jgi:HAE1 family hydrophobic/amphiphilic exporter-1
MSIAIQSSDRPLRELTDIAEEIIAPRLEAISGVGGVNRVGGVERQIRVQLDHAAMRSYAVSPAQVTAALQRENQEVPAGRVTSGQTERLVRVTGRVEEPTSFRDIVVAVRDNVPIRLSDVATVVDGTADQRSAARYNGDPAVALDLLKISGANTVKVADAVRTVVDELGRQMPPDIKLAVIRDDSRRIREALSDVQLTILLGAVLTIAIIYLFLNSWRSTVITGLTLPVSIISAFFIMWVFGFTVNTMTLLALSLAIGLLIDDAIVVRENIVRHIEMGKDHHRAAKEGTDEIGLAVISTTLAVVAVFIPVAFMGGMIGKIFLQFGVTVAFAVLVSLFVSFTLDPMLSSVWADPEIEAGKSGAHGAGASHARRRFSIRRIASGFNERFERIAERYPRWLDWSLAHRWTIMGVAAASIIAAFMILPKLGFTWMPEADVGEFSIGFRAAPGSRLEYTLDRGTRLSSMVREHPAVAFTYLNIGGGFRGSPNSGSVFVKLKPREEREHHMSEVQNALRGRLREIPGIRANVQGARSIFGGFRNPISVNVQGPEPSRLKLLAAQVLETMRKVPGVAEPQSSDEGDIPQLDVHVDRQQAWAAGLGIGSIASTLQPLFTGQRATQWEDELGYSHDVVVVYPDSMRASVEDVAMIPVLSNNIDPRTGQQAVIPLVQVAEVRAGVGPQQIERSALQRQISISSGVLPEYGVGDVAAAVKASIDSMGFPPGYRTVFGGDVQNLNETKGYVLEAILLAVIFIYLILASLFGSFVQPLSIMLALPLSFIGVALALLITKGSLNVMTMVGIIMLMGLVTKNGILLVDFTNLLRAGGEDRRKALLHAARIRLRPIIMTTAAMIFGMLPLAFAIGEGAEERAPMARAVIGGLITSTLLTLLVVPVMYTLLDDFAAWARSRSRRRGDVPAAEPQPAIGD